MKKIVLASVFVCFCLLVGFVGAQSTNKFVYEAKLEKVESDVYTRITFADQAVVKADKAIADAVAAETAFKAFAAKSPPILKYTKALGWLNTTISIATKMKSSADAMSSTAQYGDVALKLAKNSAKTKPGGYSDAIKQLDTSTRFCLISHQHSFAFGESLTAFPTAKATFYDAMK